MRGTGCDIGNSILRLQFVYMWHQAMESMKKLVSEWAVRGAHPAASNDTWLAVQFPVWASVASGFYATYFKDVYGNKLNAFYMGQV